MNMLLINVQGLIKSYPLEHGTVHALNGVDLHVHSGDFTALMGASGSGKSTLMHLLGCLDRPTSGTYQLNGQDISSLDDESLSIIRSKQIGFVFQSYNLVPQLNVYENVELPFLYRTERINAHKQIVQAIERVGLGHRMLHRPKELSGGELQRAAIARALAIHPKLILADEPTGNLDSKTGQSILELFQELNQQGATILLVTHDRSVAQHCQRILKMQDGKIVDQETAPWH